MKNKIMMWLLLLLSNVSIAQKELMPGYSTPYDDIVTCAIEDYKGNYYILVNKYDKSVGLKKKASDIYYVSSQGNVIRHKSFKVAGDSSYFLCTIFEEGNNELVLFGMHEPYGNTYTFNSLFSCRLDTMLNISDVKYTHSNLDYKHWDALFKKYSGGYLGQAWTYFPNGGGPAGGSENLYRFNKNRDSMAVQVFTPIYRIAIEEMHDSANYFLINNTKNSFFNFFKADSNLFLYDSSIVMNNGDFGGKSMKYFKEDKYILQNLQQPGMTMILHLGVRLYDKSTKAFTLWDTVGRYPNWANSDQSDGTFHYDMDFRYSNQIFYSGINLNTFFSKNNFIHIVCLDSNIQKKWHRRIGVSNTPYLSNGLIATSDGGCVVLGCIQDTNSNFLNRDLYIFKLDSMGTVTSIGNLLPTVEKRYTIYPSPAQNDIYIKDNGEGAYNFTLWNVEGKEVYRENNIKELNVKIDIGNLSKGVYLYEIRTEGGKKQSGKIMKER